MENNGIKKALYKQQPKAKFIKADNANLYYGAFIELEDKSLQQILFTIPISDIGDAKLWRDEEAKLLIRYLNN